MIMACPKAAAHAPTVVERYELLRAAMLGAALPPDSRAGLIVLLQRGMWIWARTIVLDPAQPRPVPPFSAHQPRLDGPCERRTVVHLLAAMAMTITDRRPA
ncbi:MAG: hypothetical protein ACRECE_00550 [Xanthobacteraceae bacterium]